MAEIRPKTALAVLRTWPWILTVQPPKYSRQIEGSSRSMLVFLWSKSDNLRDGLPNRSTDRHTRIAPKNSTAACDRRTEGRGGGRVNIKRNICEKSAVQWCGPTCVVCLSCQLIQFCGKLFAKATTVSISFGRYFWTKQGSYLRCSNLENSCHLLLNRKSERRWHFNCDVTQYRRLAVNYAIAGLNCLVYICKYAFSLQQNR